MLRSIALLGGLTAFMIHQVLVWTVGAPTWLLPILVVLQVWLWLGPLGPKIPTQADPWPQRPTTDAEPTKTA